MNEEKLAERGMDRRRFLKVAGISGLALGASSVMNAYGEESKKEASVTGAAPKIRDVGQKTIGIVTIISTSEGCHRLEVAEKANCDRRGWKTIIRDAEADYNKGISHFESLIEQKVDAIVNNILDCKLLGDVLDKAQKANIPFVSTFGGGDYDDRITFNITPNEYVSAARISQYLFDKVGHEGVLVGFTWPNSEPVRRRGLQFIMMMEEEQKLHLIEHTTVVPGHVEDCKKFMESKLLSAPKKGKIKGAFGAFDELAMGAALAAKSMGKEDIVCVGIDGNLATFDMIRAGSPFVATMANPLEKMGWEVIQNLEKVFLGESVHRYIYIDALLVDKNNVPPRGEYPSELLPQGWTFPKG